MSLHYSLFRVCDANGVTQIIPLQEIRALEFVPEHNHCQVRLGGTFPIDINPHDGERLLEAWNKYKQIYHAVQISQKWDEFFTSNDIDFCFQIDQCFFDIADGIPPSGIKTFSSRPEELP